MRDQNSESAVPVSTSFAARSMPVRPKITE